MRETTREPAATVRQWSRMGFILAASGSAIGLGNIVFFPANAYKFGGGAFYLPYFAALLVVGLPLMILELGLGHQERSSFPEALLQAGGKRGEFVGWWALANTGVIAVYYLAILSWVVGMLFGAAGELWREAVPTPGFTAESLPNPQGYFFATLASWRPALFVGLLWLVNAWMVRRGTESIERAVKVSVPLMWVLMLVLVVRGVTLPGGLQGVWYLFTPDFRAMADVTVWQGAFSQIFFTLSLGFGVMTAYAAYLPKRSDQVNNGLIIASLNCGFEYIAGIAVFSILFAFAAVPQASTISMMFFIVPRGIAQLPGGMALVATFGILLFTLLLLAGLSSSVSMVEAIVSGLLAKFRWSRRRAVATVCLAGAAVSLLFVLPQIVDPAIRNNGTLGLTLLDLTDHWAFNYGLLVVGLSESLLLGWGYDVTRIRRRINESSASNLGSWFDHLVRFVLPTAIFVILGLALWTEVRGGLYGASYAANFTLDWRWLSAAPVAVLVAWLLLPTALAGLLTRIRRTRERETDHGTS